MSDAKKDVRTVRLDLQEEQRRYVRTLLRHDLKIVGWHSHDLALQVWSALHPDPLAAPTRPVADIRRYVRALVNRIEQGRFVPPPRIARVRRDKARAERRKVVQASRVESNRMAEVTAALARGEYPGHGAIAPRRRHG